MKFLKILGWIFIPYIMIIFQWKKVGWGMRALGGAWALIVLIIGISNATSSKPPAVTASAPVVSAQSTVSPTKTAAPKTATITVAPTIAPTKSPEPTDTTIAVQETTGQRNAVRAAKSYLNFTAFSRKGLIKQLEFDKYSDSDAGYAVDNVGADWNEQAVKTAKNYLDNSSFSKDELIKQLEFDGYTSEQATYGVDKSYK